MSRSISFPVRYRRERRSGTVKFTVVEGDVRALGFIEGISPPGMPSVQILALYLTVVNRLEPPEFQAPSSEHSAVVF